MLNRQRGCLYGLAVGDALGAAIEFQDPGTFKEVTTYRAGGPHGLEAGQWTDDTSMALALADSISRGWDINDQAKCYVEWWQNGKYSVNGWCFDIGGTTRDGLEKFLETGDASKSGSPEQWNSGNGSIMRLAPVAIKYYNDGALLPIKCMDSSLPTHRSPQCVSACAYLGVVLGGLIEGKSKEEVLVPEYWRSQLKGIKLHKEIEDVANGSFRTNQPPRIVGSGYVVKSLEAALWAFFNAGDFREAVLKAVNLGDDSDTTGAVCGQLAGAFWGEAGIPSEWLDGLARKDMIEAALKVLV